MTYECGNLPFPFSFTGPTLKELQSSEPVPVPKSKQEYGENPFEQLEAHSVYLSVYREDKFQLCGFEMP